MCYLPIVPFGASRHRMAAVKTKAGKVTVRSYKDNSYSVRQQSLRATMLEALPALASYEGNVLSGPVILDLVAIFPRSSAEQTLPKRSDTPLKFSAGRYPHIKKPDRDNVDKAVLDCLAGDMGVLHDDCQVFAGHLLKLVGSIDEPPSVSIAVHVNCQRKFDLLGAMGLLEYR
jgi:Holliday junction resolvase RusA-like endonuclease